MTEGKEKTNIKKQSSTTSPIGPPPSPIATADVNETQKSNKPHEINEIYISSITAMATNYNMQIMSMYNADAVFDVAGIMVMGAFAKLPDDQKVETMQRYVDALTNFINVNQPQHSGEKNAKAQKRTED